MFLIRTLVYTLCLHEIRSRSKAKKLFTHAKKIVKKSIVFIVDIMRNIILFGEIWWEVYSYITVIDHVIFLKIQKYKKTLVTSIHQN